MRRTDADDPTKPSKFRLILRLLLDFSILFSITRNPLKRGPASFSLLYLSAAISPRASLSSSVRFGENLLFQRMSGGAGGTNSSLRKALGSIKDTTTISLAKVNSDYKELDIAIVKATNHVEYPAKEKHIRAIFAAISATRPRADVAYCIHALARRLSRTHNWAVALKTLIVIHRALREVDPTFHEELINYGRSRSHMLNLAHFKDDSSANAWDYSAWVRAYALFLEERLECFRVLNYDVETDRPRTKDLETVELLEQLPALQQLLYRVIGCQPEGAAVHNFVIHIALSMIASESMKIYNAISDGTFNLVDKFFEMLRQGNNRSPNNYSVAIEFEIIELKCSVTESFQGRDKVEILRVLRFRWTE
ncbi:hypothetical protein Nepgr_029148 [Nepenthes gracilis]|uniref:ENTH domain-containing protein n=1 Tax=Nepenthes gracilis TaxID=150966 RepID=A0AAD3TBW2_NEPGR|nr:hypothetical protein Nepgr_029148 [Nepenthes gracilis]